VAFTDFPFKGTEQDATGQITGFADAGARQVADDPPEAGRTAARQWLRAGRSTEAVASLGPGSMSTGITWPDTSTADRPAMAATGLLNPGPGAIST
jgi:hypothetical protein